MEQLYCMTMYNVQPARAVVKTSEWSSILRHFFRIYDVQFTFALDDIGNNNGGFAGANRCDNSIGMTNVADGLEAPGVNENLKL
jgi:hypothetical protein